MTVYIYHYNGQGLYTTSTEARTNPRQPEETLVPAKATLIAPPEITEPYSIAQFDGQSWSIIPDYRDYLYFTPDDGEAVIDDVNITPPGDSIEMSAEDHLIQDDDGTWRLMSAEDDLDAYKQDKINSLKNSFTLELKEDGLNSSALGSEHKYDAEQHNIDWVLACNTLMLKHDDETPLITCDDLLDNENSKLPIPHDEDQCAALLLDCMTIIQSMKDKLAGLKTDVDNATNESEVDSIVWN